MPSVCLFTWSSVGGASELLSPDRTPPVTNHAHCVGHTGVKVNTKQNVSLLFNKIIQEILAIFTVFKSFMSQLNYHVQWRAVSLITDLKE